MKTLSFLTACGSYCDECPHFKTTCQGCEAQKGKPFWTAQMTYDMCPIYDCCKNKKALEHCGLCGALPCALFKNLRDPSLSDEAFEESLLYRQRNLMKRKKESKF